MSIDREMDPKEEIFKKEKEGKNKEIRQERDIAVTDYLKKEGLGADVIEAEEMEPLAEESAEKCIESLSRLYETEDIPADVKEKLNERKELQNFDGLSGDIVSMLNQDLKDGRKFYEVLQEKLEIKEKPGIGNLKEQIEKILEDCQEVIKMEDGEKEFLVNGDLDIKNTHIGENSEVKFSKLEWATFSKNKALAFIFDYGNLRGRAMDNPKLQEALDEAIRKEFKGNPDLGEAIVKLGILRTSIKFLKYDAIKEANGEKLEFNGKQQKSMEKDIKKFFPESSENK